MRFTTGATRKNRGLRVVAAASALALMLAACGGTDDDPDADPGAADTDSDTDTDTDADADADTDTDAPDTEIELAIRIADGYPGTNPLVVGGAEPFMERLVEEGAARGIAVEVDYYGDQSLAGQAELLDTVGTGVADIAAVAFSYFAEVIPAAGISELPARYESSEEGSVVFLQLIQEELMEEFNAQNLRPIFLGALAPYELFSTDRPLEQPEDTQGMNIRSPGGVCDDSLSAVGANPVQMPVSDQYVALERGTINGVVGPHANHRAYQIEEGAAHATSGLAMCGVTNMYLANEDWFQSQPQEVQDLLTEIGAETTRSLGQFLDDAEDEATEYYEESGVTIAYIEDTSAWEDALAEIQAQWVERMDGQGVDGQALLDRWDELVAEFN